MRHYKVLNFKTKKDAEQYESMIDYFQQNMKNVIKDYEQDNKQKINLIYLFNQYFKNNKYEIKLDYISINIDKSYTVGIQFFKNSYTKFVFHKRLLDIGNETAVS